MSSISRHVIVAGRVQGVAFRWWTREQALDLNLRGWVRNLADGRVELHVEGDEVAVRTFVRKLGKGPPLARVAELDERESAPEGLPDFEIRATAHGA